MRTPGQRALASFGAPLHELTVEDLSAAETVFQIGVEPNRVDLLTTVAGVGFGDAWNRRQPATYGEIPIFIVSLEDLLACKQASARPRDLLDLESLERAKQEKS